MLAPTAQQPVTGWCRVVEGRAWPIDGPPTDSTLCAFGMPAQANMLTAPVTTPTVLIAEALLAQLTQVVEDYEQSLGSLRQHNVHKKRIEAWELRLDEREIACYRAETNGGVDQAWQILIKIVDDLCSWCWPGHHLSADRNHTQWRYSVVRNYK